jgi:hypothetical protein
MCCMQLQGFGRSTSKIGAGAGTPSAQEQAAGRQQSSKSASALKKLASGNASKTPKVGTSE